jgi:predicted ATPase
VSGPGGSGKTRFALEVTAGLHDSFEHGAWVIDLGPITDHALVISEIAHVLGVGEPADRPLLEVLGDELRDEQILLVLDNFEQVLEAAPALATLLRTCPDLRLLVTSREPLGLSWEHILPMPPLRLPELGSRSAVDAIAKSPAVQLFLLRTRAVQPDFEPVPNELRAIAEVCRLLDGLPLAIELAAAQGGCR